jgi:dihydrofolate reductase
MRKIIVSEWITLDGVFDADLFDEWFLPYDSEERGEHIGQIIKESGALLMGFNTYEMLAPYWSQLKNNEMGVADKMNSVPKYVVAEKPLKTKWSNVEKVIKDNVAEEVKKLKVQEGGPIVIYGSAMLVRALMDAGLVDEFRFLVHPIILGHGKRFFTEDIPGAKLELAESKQLPNGVMALTYKPAG